jgi:hypothetical protein
MISDLMLGGPSLAAMAASWEDHPAGKTIPAWAAEPHLTRSLDHVYRSS